MCLHLFHPRYGVHRHSSSCITAFVFHGRHIPSDSSGFIELQRIVKLQKSTSESQSGAL
ncbi:MAG: hypothetical protein LBF66_00185 [Holosporales bacterium]|nr:hypothetical protein [Holosporales bacterium]